ncbi:hypothetical protein M6D93_02720 [Jatrophihabitans telluris]|uniref:NTP pyrophosphohydrolase MazG putative catalytic core domain-containing protein n=1 Tax=Jatrophihabitans telluris TaxID=2038343 RepID=A0ABY4R1A9_9ACTN|nr:hypothetical protein [Jatrophihabitans telluris]UQX88920.1 hypothetical protein M6D93_02720 [Jatrophihabitans telluris]
MTDLQTDVAAAADRAEAHSTAPALLLQLQACLGQLAAAADGSTEGGRRPYRVPTGWADKLGELGFLVYLLADQTGVSVDEAVRRVSAGVNAEADRRAAQHTVDTDSWL